MFFGETLMCLSLWIFAPRVVAAEDRVHAGPRWRGEVSLARQGDVAFSTSDATTHTGLWLFRRLG